MPPVVGQSNSYITLIQEEDSEDDEEPTEHGAAAKVTASPSAVT